MTRDDVFRGLLAALRLKEIKYIDTRNDAQHVAFRRVVDALKDSVTQHPGVPITFVPSPFTGRYRELDEALLQLQRGLLGAQNPFYPGVNVKLSPERAQRILQEYSTEEQKLFFNLASIFMDEQVVAEQTA